MTEAIAKLFIVEDELSISDNFLHYLEDYAEFQAIAYPSGEVALENLEKEKPHLCIVDMRLPGMDGVEFIKHARAVCPACRFLIHTGSIDLTLTSPLKNMGLTEQDLFYKPAEMELILRRIREVLGIEE